MTEYRNPKGSSNGKTNSADGLGRWLGIAVGAIVLLLFLSWLLGWFDRGNTNTAQPAATQSSVATLESQVLQGEVTGSTAPAGEVVE